MNFPDRIAMQFEQALTSGAVMTYATDEKLVKDDIDFIVFVLKHLSVRDRKFWNKGQKEHALDSEKDPFLPYEKDLFVNELTKTHICLLNKYNVMKNHILIVTRSFEDQETPLTEFDFEALWLCMEKIEGLAFYNSGVKAGASQRHKHLQLIKLPLTEQMDRLPIGPLISSLKKREGPLVVPRFEFRHGLYFLPENVTAHYLLEKYDSLLEYTGLSDKWGPYNLLVTKEWMLLVPRTLESYKGISVNSLGFAGTFLVKDLREFGEIKRTGFFGILNSVSSPL